MSSAATELLAPAGRPPQQQDPATRLVTLGRGLEVAHQSVQRHVEPEQLVAEEVVGDLAGVEAVGESGGPDHVVDPLVRCGGDRRPLCDPVDVLVERDDLGVLGGVHALQRLPVPA